MKNRNKSLVTCHSSLVCNERRGQLSVIILLFASVTLVLVTGFAILAGSFLQLSTRSWNKSQAFAIAEAGIEYYRWHLAHAPQDYQDGTGSPGPYTHAYYNKNNAAIGQFSLSITPPPSGSTVVTVQSTGKVFADNSITKIIQVKFAIPSFAKYAWVLNDFVVFGSAAEVFGPIQSNGLIHFDGIAHNLVSSALTTSTDPDTGLTEWAVFTQSGADDPQPPAALPTRADVFMAGRTLGVPAVDFAGITQDLATIKANAQGGGYYAPSSTVFGYDLVFSATSSVFSLNKVTALTAAPHNCSNPGGADQQGWGTWSIQTEVPYITSTIPANGNIFIEDNLWVRGQINNQRVTIASGRFPVNPATYSNITVNNALKYTNYNGSDTLALISQNNINVGLVSDDSLRIDGALIAQNGRIGRYSYNSNCGATRSRTLLTTYGMLGTALRPAFYYSATNGYQARSYIYDANLLYGPPPSFPLTTDEYTPISWNEVQ